MRRLPYSILLVLFAGSLILSLNMGLRQTLGLFIPDMAASTGWPIGVFAFAFAIQNLLWGLASPVCGILADRFGTARTVAGGGLVYAVGLALMAAPLGPIWFQVNAGMVLGLGISACTFPIVLGAVGQRTPAAWRSLALGIASTGGSLGQFLLAPVAGGLLEAFGWQQALFWLGALALLMVPAGWALAARSPEPDAGGGAAPSGAELAAAIRQAFRHPGYRLLSAGFFVCGFHVAFITVHLPIFASVCGLAPSVATNSIALIGLFNVIGTLAAGALGQRFRKKRLLSAIYLARAISILIFLAAPKTELSFLVFSSVIGLLWLSTVPLTSGLVDQIFGPRFLATLFGVVMLSHQVGAFAGAALGGVVYDWTGNYDLVFQIAAGLGLAAALLHLPIRDARMGETTAQRAA